MITIIDSTHIPDESHIPGIPHIPEVTQIPRVPHIPVISCIDVAVRSFNKIGTILIQNDGTTIVLNAREIPLYIEAHIYAAARVAIDGVVGVN